MARVTLAEVQGWLDAAKLTLTSLNAQLLANLEEEILSRLSVAYDTSGWTTDLNTPKLVRVIISKTYSSWEIDKAYSENQDEGNDYAKRLNDNAEMLINGIVEGNIIIPEEPVPDLPRGPSFYPTDASSAQEPTYDDPSLGGPYFSLGRSF